MKLIMKMVDIAVQKIVAYPYEIILVALYSFLSVALTLLFWNVLFSSIGFENFEPEFIYILGFCGLFSDGLCEIFFGLRDLDYLIQTGEFDRYLVMPHHPIYLLILENLPIVSIVEELLLSVAGIIVVCLHYRVSVSAFNALKGLLFIILGTFYYELIYGLVTVLAFRFESIASTRDLIFQVNTCKQYPMSIFPTEFKAILTHIIPVGLLAYYPAVLLLGMNEPLPRLYLSIPVVVLAAPCIYRWCVRRYSSNGG